MPLFFLQAKKIRWSGLVVCATLCPQVLIDMATGAADGFFRYVYDGCLCGGDMGIERRPYHRNCRCALHKSRENCGHSMPKCKNVSYPMKRSWSEGCLALVASCHSSPSSSPSLQVVEVGRTQLGLCNEEEDELQGSLLKA